MSIALQAKVAELERRLAELEPIVSELQTRVGGFPIKQSTDGPHTFQSALDPPERKTLTLPEKRKSA